MIILHGEHTVNSRKELQELLDLAGKQNQPVTRLTGSSLSLAEVESILGNLNLFGDSPLIIIENIFAGRVSKAKTAIIDLLANHEPENLVIWEDKKVGVRILNKFKKTKKQEFPITKELFNWLDTLGIKPKSEQIKKLHLALNQEESYFVFLMLARQIRMMIQLKDSGALAGSPYVVNKLKRQAANFTLNKLISLHNLLLQIDLRQKTSKNSLSLVAELDLFVLNM